MVSLKLKLLLFIIDAALMLSSLYPFDLNISFRVSIKCFSHLAVRSSRVSGLYRITKGQNGKMKKYLPWIDDSTINLENGNSGRLRNGELRHLFRCVQLREALNFCDDYLLLSFREDTWFFRTLIFFILQGILVFFLIFGSSPVLFALVDWIL